MKKISKIKGKAHADHTILRKVSPELCGYISGFEAFDKVPPREQHPIMHDYYHVGDGHLDFVKAP